MEKFAKVIAAAVTWALGALAQRVPEIAGLIGPEVIEFLTGVILLGAVYLTPNKIGGVNVAALAAAAAHVDGQEPPEARRDSGRVSRRESQEAAE